MLLLIYQAAFQYLLINFFLPITSLQKCLEAIKDLVVKSSVLAFDETCDHDSPGETLALQDVFGIRNIRLKRFPYNLRLFNNKGLTISDNYSRYLLICLPARQGCKGFDIRCTFRADEFSQRTINGNRCR